MGTKCYWLHRFSSSQRVERGITHQSGRNCGVGSQRTCSHFSALSPYFNNFQQKIPYFATKESLISFCNKAMSRYACELSVTHSGSQWLFLVVSSSLWFPLALTGSLCGSLWLLLALSLPVSLWLSMALCDSHSGSLWLPLALTCSLRLSLALSGFYWISPCLSLALYGSL